MPDNYIYNTTMIEVQVRNGPFVIGVIPVSITLPVHERARHLMSKISMDMILTAEERAWFDRYQRKAQSRYIRKALKIAAEIINRQQHTDTLL